MAGASIPRPGTELGPCKGRCHHRDCKASREQAAQVCSLCSKRIGYNRNWVNDPEHGPVHELCLVIKIEGTESGLRITSMGRKEDD